MINEVFAPGMTAMAAPVQRARTAAIGVDHHRRAAGAADRGAHGRARRAADGHRRRDRRAQHRVVAVSPFGLRARTDSTKVQLAGVARPLPWQTRARFLRETAREAPGRSFKEEPAAPKIVASGASRVESHRRRRRAGLGLWARPRPLTSLDRAALAARRLAGASPTRRPRHAARHRRAAAAAPGPRRSRSAFVDGRCKLVLSMRGNPEAEATLERIEPELLGRRARADGRARAGPLPALSRRRLARRAGRLHATACPRAERRASRGLRDDERGAARGGLRRPRRTGLDGRAPPAQYARVHAWLVAERSRDLVPGSAHDTLAWVRLAADRRRGRRTRRSSPCRRGSGARPRRRRRPALPTADGAARPVGRAEAQPNSCRQARRSRAPSVAATKAMPASAPERCASWLMRPSWRREAYQV